MNAQQIEALALAEWQQFIGSKTVKAVGAFVAASTEEYVRGLVTGQSHVDFKTWAGTLALSAVALTIRHALAGIEAKLDAQGVTLPKE